MLKEHDPPKEPVRSKLSEDGRIMLWRSAFVEERQKPKLVDPDKEPEMAETIINEGRRDGPVKRFESRFIKEIRMTLDEHIISAI